MGSSRILSNYDCRKGNAVSLFEWIGKVKCKKVEMRRKRRHQDLRVAAILTTALQRAERDMKLKQQERALKWAQLNIELQRHSALATAEGEERHKQEVSDMWNSELSELDEFINSLSQVKTTIVR